MFDKLRDLIGRRDQFDQPTQDTITSWMKTAQELAVIEEAKETEGWKRIEQKIRDELKIAITAMITEAKDERAGRINALLQVLSSMDTKTVSDVLHEQINDFVDKY